MANSHNGPFSTSAMGYNRNYNYQLTTDNLFSNQRNTIKSSHTQRHEESQEYGIGQHSPYNATNDNNQANFIDKKYQEPSSMND